LSGLGLGLPFSHRGAAILPKPPQQDPGAILTKAASREVVLTFMDNYSVPGMSMAIAKNGQLQYSEGFGYADKDSREKTTTHHLFRIASISKPFTAVAIMRLAEERKVRLSDRVFGSASLLGSDYGQPPFKRYVDEITVEHLMTHTAGGWTNDDSDPMFRHQEFDHRALIAWAISEVGLKYRPGTRFAYSNFGYCILGRVIEKVTGLSYEAAVQKYVLDDCGIHRMKIGGNTLAERVADEDEQAAVVGDAHRADGEGGEVRVGDVVHEEPDDRRRGLREGLRRTV